MKQGTDIAREFPGILVIHQKIRGSQKDSHLHEGDHEFFVPLQGEIRIRATGTGEEFAAGPGRMIYLPPGLEHSFQSSRSAQGERLIFMVKDTTWRANDPRVIRALDELRRSACGTLRMEAIAKRSGLSLRNLNRLFLLETGMSPKQFVTRVRVETAQRLLKGGRRTVTDVALEVGYGSVSQFIAAFRKITGQLPSEYGGRGKK